MIGIIILNYKTPVMTQKCVASVMEKTESVYKIYVVDNHSEDQSYEMLKNVFQNVPQVCVMNSTVNDGYSAGNNIGVKRAIQEGATEIVILNSDVTFENNVIDLMYNSLCSKKNIAVVGPQIRNAKGENGQLLRKVYDFKYYLFQKKPFNILTRILPKLSPKYEYKMDSDLVFGGMVSGCCFMIKAQAFLQMGLFDENIFLYCEEWILSKKLQKLGLKTCYSAKAKIIHNESGSMSQSKKGFQSFFQNISALYYLKMYTDTSKRQLIFAARYIVFSFCMMSLSHKEYYKFYKRIKTDTLLILNAKDKTDNGELRIRL